MPLPVGHVLAVALLVSLLLLNTGNAQPSEKEALLEFKASVQKCSPGTLSDWEEDQSIEEWEGLTVDSEGVLVNISFYAAGHTSGSGGLIRGSLCGDLPPSFSVLTGLQSLILTDNKMNGALPVEWSKLRNLRHLNLGNQWLQGTIPPQWSTLTKLTSISLDSNQLTGPLPDSWSDFTDLNELSLGGNAFKGPLPSSWSSLMQMRYLSLTGMGLNGTLPAAYSKLEKVESLNLGNNTLSGTMPSEWTALTALETLDLRMNSLNGPLPSLAGFTSLAWLALSNNFFEGPIPSSWDELKQLTRLELSENRLNGPLPEAFSGFKGLYELHLGSNHFQSTLPAAWSELRSLRNLHVRNNSLSGTVPVEWAALRFLQVLDVSYNRLNGPLPAPWSNMTELHLLSLANNNLEGPIPSSWIIDGAWWINAGYIDISSNRLNGPLPEYPSSIQYFNASHNSFTGNMPDFKRYNPLFRFAYLNLRANNLTGTIPDSNTTLRSLSFVDLRDNQLDRLPEVLDVPSVVYFSVANNRLQGSLPEKGYNLSSMVYCDMSQNELTGSVPALWHDHGWLYLALDHNKLSANLTSFAWRGNVSVLLMQHNNFTGCLPLDWPRAESARVLSFASNPIDCLPDKWGSMFRNLSMLDLSNVDAKRVPLSWLQPSAFRGLNETWLRLGDKLWLSSSEQDESVWRRDVCMLPDLNKQLEQSLDAKTLAPDVESQINDAVTEGLKELNKTISTCYGSCISVVPLTTVNVRIGALNMRLDNLKKVRVLDICGNKLALLIVSVQWGVIAVSVALLVTLYCTAVRWKKSQQQDEKPTPSSYLSSSGRLISNESIKMLSNDGNADNNPSTASNSSNVTRVITVIGLGSYWFDVISDIVVICTVWEYNGWPRYFLLAFFVLHFVVAICFMACRLHISPVSKALLLLFGLPLMPLFDTVTFIFTVLGTYKGVCSHLIEATNVMQWGELLEMRDILEVFIEAIPTAVLQTVVFMLGNNPQNGWYLSHYTYLLSAVGTSVHLVMFVASLLWQAYRQDVSPGATMWRALRLKPKEDLVGKERPLEGSNSDESAV